jgi:hypothetical protein
MGTRPVGEAQASATDAVIALDPNEQVKAGELVTAEQSTTNDTSVALPPEQGIEVMADPDTEQLNGLFCPEPLLECATCLWVAGAVPGATVTLELTGDPPMLANATSEFVKFTLPTGRRLHVTDSVTASQTACGVAGSAIQLPSPLANIRGGPTLPVIDVATPVQCQQGIRVDGVTPGTTIVVVLDGQDLHGCFASTRGWFGLPRRLEVGDTLPVSQEFPLCKTLGDQTTVTVTESTPPVPAVLGPVCEKDRLIRIAGLIPGARLELALDDQPLCVAGAADSTMTLGIPSILGGHALTARQSVCDGLDGTWSAWSAPRRVAALGPTSEPQIVEPLIAGGVAIGVTGVTRGTFVQVVGRWGVLGEGWGNGDRRLDIPLWFPLTSQDLIHLRTLRCSELRDWPTSATVEGGRDVTAPAVSDPACDCGGSILVHDVLPGAIVEVFKLTASALPAWAGTARAGDRDVSVDVPPLSPGDRLQARQRIGSMRSSSGPIGTAPARPLWAYVPDSAFRLCQLTQDWDPTGRPHPVNTTQFGITGTDLGIPAEHKGRLHLFFGDSAEAPFSESDGDPIAWLTNDDPDEFETAAPDIHWILSDGGQFRRLVVEGVSLANFEVPTGAFSYDGHLYVFVSTNRQENPLRMTASWLAASDDPHNDFVPVRPISSTAGGQILVLEKDGSHHPAPFPGGRWLLHVSPTVVRNADWPGLPSTAGDGLLMFGSSLYRGVPPSDRTAVEHVQSNVYLAWAPLTPGVTPPHAPVPPADEWHFFTGLTASGTPNWGTLKVGATPVPVLPADPWGPRLLGEISAVWYAALRRWILTGSVQAPINVARTPWGPWTTSDTVCDLQHVDPSGHHDRDAGDSIPGGEWTDFQVTYAPYLIERWLHWDRSDRKANLHYTLSVYDEPHGQKRYQPQLMRSAINCWH